MSTDEERIRRRLSEASRTPNRVAANHSERGTPSTPGSTYSGDPSSPNANSSLVQENKKLQEELAKLKNENRRLKEEQAQKDASLNSLVEQSRGEILSLQTKNDEVTRNCEELKREVELARMHLMQSKQSSVNLIVQSATGNTMQSVSAPTESDSRVISNRTEFFKVNYRVPQANERVAKAACFQEVISCNVRSINQIAVKARLSASSWGIEIEIKEMPKASGDLPKIPRLFDSARVMFTEPSPERAGLSLRMYYPQNYINIAIEDDEAQKVAIGKINRLCHFSRNVLYSCLTIPNSSDRRQSFLLTKLPSQQLHVWTWCVLSGGLITIYNDNGTVQQPIDIRGATQKETRYISGFATFDLLLNEKLIVSLGGTKDDLSYWEEAVTATIDKYLNSASELEWKVKTNSLLVSTNHILRIQGSQILVLKENQSADDAPHLIYDIRKISDPVAENAKVTFKSSERPITYVFDSNSSAENFVIHLTALKKEPMMQQEVLHEGYLILRNSVSGLSKEKFYWVTLSKDFIRFFNNHTNMRQLCNERVSLCGICQSDEISKSLQFTITTQKKSYQLMAFDKASLDAWVKRIQGVIQAVYVNRFASGFVSISPELDNYLKSSTFDILPSAHLPKRTLFSDSMITANSKFRVETDIKSRSLTQSKGNVIVLDQGHINIRIGLHGIHKYPFVVPAIVSVDNFGAGFKAYGFDAMKNVLQFGHSFKYIVEQDSGLNLELMEEYFNHLFQNVVKIDPTDKALVVVCSRAMYNQKRAALEQFYLKRLKVSRVIIKCQDEIIPKAFSQKDGFLVSMGKTLEISAFVSQGRAAHTHSRPFGSEQLTNALLDELQSSSNSLVGSKSKLFLIADEIKQKYCKVLPEPDIVKTMQNVPPIIHKASHTQEEITIRSEIFEAPEILFSRESKNLGEGLCDFIINYGRKELDRTAFPREPLVVLKGGFARMPGICERLEYELKQQISGFEVELDKDLRGFSDWEMVGNLYVDTRFDD